MATPPDFAEWLTKEEAAAAIGVAPKTIERFVAGRQLQQATRRAARGPARAVYHPADVARLAAERQAGPSAVVLPPTPARMNGTATALAPTPAVTPPVGEAVGLVAALVAIAEALRAGTPSMSQTSETRFLTLRDAAALTGLSAAYLRRAIAAGTLPAIRDRGWRIRRRDLEAL